MYAGIALGIYVISTSRGPAPYEGPDTYEDYSELRSRIEPPALLASQPPKEALELMLLSLSF
jgi:hypothetical protein